MKGEDETSHDSREQKKTMQTNLLVSVTSQYCFQCDLRSTYPGTLIHFVSKKEDRSGCTIHT